MGWRRGRWRGSHGLCQGYPAHSHARPPGHTRGCLGRDLGPGMCVQGVCCGRRVQRSDPRAPQHVGGHWSPAGPGACGHCRLPDPQGRALLEASTRRPSAPKGRQLDFGLSLAGCSCSPGVPLGLTGPAFLTPADAGPGSSAVGCVCLVDDTKPCGPGSGRRARGGGASLYTVLPSVSVLLSSSPCSV